MIESKRSGERADNQIMNDYIFCCNEMYLNVYETCSIMYEEKYDEYSIKCFEDDFSQLTLFFCPWCGKKLPDSKRDLWFSELEQLGFSDPLFFENIPGKYKSSEWWRDKTEEDQSD